ncbi:hypothetical protein ADIAL_1425 [Alkalibacterium sp. AK22]|nr:hypothetical protein ADIAL_1425 [Alkalibacterium sp. AK22]
MTSRSLDPVPDKGAGSFQVFNDKTAIMMAINWKKPGNLLE